MHPPLVLDSKRLPHPFPLPATNQKNPLTLRSAGFDDTRRQEMPCSVVGSAIERRRKMTQRGMPAAIQGPELLLARIRSAGFVQVKGGTGESVSLNLKFPSAASG